MDKLISINEKITQRIEKTMVFSGNCTDRIHYFKTTYFSPDSPLTASYDAESDQTTFCQVYDVGR